MNNEDFILMLGKLLFEEEGMHTYAVLDGASMPNLLGVLETHEPEHECLYRGELEPDMAEVVPYLIYLDNNTDFPWWLAAKGWGKHWGIILQSEVNLRALRRHLRQFLIVYDPMGKPMYFRWYDPRVLSVFLPTCTPEELTTFFGPISCFFLESADGAQAFRFRLSAGELQTETLSLAASSA
ncbi:MAG TPA: DUF4123 domain-containing protein [Blastocatellia bacterium]|nr:DUF4123 domain-containing protein [Blastocatellia bacterium]